MCGIVFWARATDLQISQITDITEHAKYILISL
jgi:hypothetical protein